MSLPSSPFPPSTLPLPDYWHLLNLHSLRSSKEAERQSQLALKKQREQVFGFVGRQLAEKKEKKKVLEEENSKFVDFLQRKTKVEEMKEQETEKMKEEKKLKEKELREIELREYRIKKKIGKKVKQVEAFERPLMPSEVEWERKNQMKKKQLKEDSEMFIQERDRKKQHALEERQYEKEENLEYRNRVAKEADEREEKRIQMVNERKLDVESKNLQAGQFDESLINKKYQKLEINRANRVSRESRFHALSLLSLHQSSIQSKADLKFQLENQIIQKKEYDNKIKVRFEEQAEIWAKEREEVRKREEEDLKRKRERNKKWGEELKRQIEEKEKRKKEERIGMSEVEKRINRVVLQEIEMGGK